MDFVCELCALVVDKAFSFTSQLTEDASTGVIASRALCAFAVNASDPCQRADDFRYCKVHNKRNGDARFSYLRALDVNDVPSPQPSSR